MGCACQQGRSGQLEARENKVRNMAKMVSFEGKMVPFDTIPEGSLFIRGTWYASAAALPESLKNQYGKLFRTKLIPVFSKKSTPTPVGDQEDLDAGDGKKANSNSAAEPNKPTSEKTGKPVVGSKNSSRSDKENKK